jgi:RNA polymerase sigma factor (TIGR02999 family)
MSDTAELTIVLQRAATGDRSAQEQFCRLVYGELREAARFLLWDGQRASFEPSALVNELFVRVFERDLLKTADNRRYFFTAAVDQMRKILIDHHRRQRTLKAGGQRNRVPLDTVLDQVLCELESKTKCDLLALEDALKTLGRRQPRQAEVVRLRFYGGLNHRQIAELLDISVSTVEREWRLAKAKLYADLRGETA